MNDSTVLFTCAFLRSGYLGETDASERVVLQTAEMGSSSNDIMYCLYSSSLYCTPYGFGVDSWPSDVQCPDGGPSTDLRGKVDTQES